MKHVFILLTFISFYSFGIVDVRSAGYSKSFVDFETQAKGFPLKVERTYNSRSLFNGLFGFGWCSNFETQLEVLPDNSLKIAECGGGLESFYFPKNKKANVSLQTALILKAMKAKNVRMNKKGLNKLKADLVKSPTLRADFLKALDIKGQATKGEVYYKNGSSNEFITVKNNSYQRKLPSGLSEVFNKKGKLVRSFDNSGNLIDIKWQANFVSVVDNLGNRLILKLSSSKKIKKITFNKKSIASYQYKGEDLAKVSNSYKEVFYHAYNDFHDLVKTVYPDKTTETLRYNEKKDWVMGFKDRRGCQEDYKYATNAKNPDHYFATVQKKCGRKIVNKSVYEFWNKTLANGSKYLHRARSKVNGRLKTDAIFHPKFGSPTSFYKNGVRTRRSFYKNGLLKLKKDPYRTVEYKNYLSRCDKPTHVNVSYTDNRTKKVLKKETIKFSFKKNCQLSYAKKSNDEWISIQHNAKGQLSCMKDQSQKQICVTWHKTLNKPEVITRVGLGSIRVVYDKAGDVVDLKASDKSGATIISQVSSVFNSFLQTLAPVAEEMVIL